MKIAIVGTAPNSRLIAPYEDDSWEIWACSAGNSQSTSLPRVTKWFELHSIIDMMGAENKAWCVPYYNWLREQKFPIYMQEKNDYVPQAIVFPYRKLTERFGPNPEKGLSNWFTSSVAWMWAYALLQMKEGDEVAIFGVDMAAAEEAYTAQKAGLLRFVEFSNAMGVKVTIPFESCLGKTFPLYGYAEATRMGRKLAVRQHEIKSQLNNINAQLQQLVNQQNYFSGALEAVNYDIRTWTDGMDAEIDVPIDESPMIDVLKTKAQVLTKDFAENNQGVFVPIAAASNAPAKSKTKSQNGAAEA
jgi:hypothetical protein